LTLTDRLQIDAILTDTPGRLVPTFCGGAWNALPDLWTIVPHQVFEEAARRGWECFIGAGPGWDNFGVLEDSAEYASSYFERGEMRKETVRIFPTLELAVRDMLTRRMEQWGLIREPANAV
jgi:hypothetical protein